MKYSFSSLYVCLVFPNAESVKNQYEHTSKPRGNHFVSMDILPEMEKQDKIQV